MRVLKLGAYDAILGVDWLKQYNPISCDWLQKIMFFTYNGSQITLQGVLPSSLDIVREMPIKHLVKWSKGNEIWALAVRHDR